MSNVVSISNAREAPKAAQSDMHTVIATPELVNQWEIPGPQRELRVNKKVRLIAEYIKKTEVIPGVITLGTVRGQKQEWLVDGRHRRHSFLLSEMPEAFLDIRKMTFDTMEDLATEFYQLNSHIVNMQPDDNLRALAYSQPLLVKITKHCEFVGYGAVRRGGSGSGPILSMASLLRCYFAAANEVPSSNTGGAADLAFALDDKAVNNMIAFLNIAHSAWGRDPEYYKLWGNLNLTMCIWLWNKLVVDRDRAGKKYSVINAVAFKRCLMSLSAEGDYVAWLTGRVLADRDRGPCYTRIKNIFTRRLIADSDGGAKPTLPSPAWWSSR